MVDKTKADKLKRKMFENNDAIEAMAEQAPNGRLYERRDSQAVSESEPRTQSDTQTGTLYADQIINKHRNPNRQVLLKVPESVLDYVSDNADTSANHSVIYYYMLLEGMKVLDRQLREGDTYLRLNDGE